MNHSQDFGRVTWGGAYMQTPLNGEEKNDKCNLL